MTARLPGQSPRTLHAMATYPPPPPGGGYASAGPAGYDPHAAQRALDAWAEARNYRIYQNPDPVWYAGWAPFVFLFRLDRIGRELRATYADAKVWVVEAFEDDRVKQAAGEDRHLVALVTSPRIGYRAALRSRTGAGFVDAVGRGADVPPNSAARAAGALLHDPTFEARYEVAGPTRDEAHAALPMGLRHHLLQTGFAGILELRAGGLVCTSFQRRGFDPATLDALLTTVGAIHQAATHYDHPVTAPPR